MKRLVPSAMRSKHTGGVTCVAEIFLSASTPSHPKYKPKKSRLRVLLLFVWLVGGLNFFLEAPEAP